MTESRFEKEKRSGIVTELRSAFDDNETGRALDLLRKVSKARGAPVRLSASLYTKGIRAAIDADDVPLADWLLGQGRLHEADRADHWDKLLRRIGVAKVRGIREATEQRDWALAAGRLQELARTATPEDLGTVQSARRLLQDWVGVLRDEAALQVVLGVDGPDKLPEEAVLLGTQARMKLGATEAALNIVQERQRVVAPTEKMRRLEARLRSHLGDVEGALAILLPLWESGVPSLLPAVVDRLIELRDFDRCELILTEAHETAGGAPGSAIRLAHINLMRSMGRHQQALDEARALEGVLAPDEHLRLLVKVAAEGRHFETLNGLLLKVDGLLDGEAASRRNAAGIAEILATNWRYSPNWKPLERGLSALEQLVLAPREAVKLAGVRVSQGRYDLARTVLQRSLELFPSSPQLRQRLSVVLGVIGDPKGITSARSDLLEHMPPGIGLNVLAGADPTAWREQDIPALMQCAVNSREKGVTTNFFRGLVRTKLSAAQFSAIFDTVANNISPANAARIEIVRATAVDHHRLESSALEPVDFQEFLTSAEDNHRRVMNSLRACVANVSPEMSPSHRRWMENCLEAYEKIDSKSDWSTLMSGQSFAHAAILAGQLMKRIVEKQPTSAIRIGDGEGTFLPAHEECLPYVEADRDMIQQMWWGEARLSSAQASTIVPAFREAVDQADIIGLIPPARLVIADLKQLDIKHGARGILNGLAYFDAPGKRLPLMASAHFHEDLRTWNLWPEIFSATSRVSWISCHDLGDFLWNVHGVETRKGIRIPGEHKYAVLFSNPEWQGKEREFTLLDRHEEVCRTIDPEPGEVFLVAAGWLGKIYCDIVRNRGGIGLDIGSLADRWMGFNTRGGRQISMAPPSVGTAFIRDTPLPKIDIAPRILGRSDVVRSTIDGRYNIGRPGDADGQPARVRKTLRVVGHPRCATGYMATLFSSFGIEIGHETLLKDGIASWMHVVADDRVPYGDGGTGVDFDHTVVVVRSPRDAIPSIMVENAVEASFNFRRQHILRATGEDICGYTRPLDRALASFLAWYDMSLNMGPDALFRAESAEAEVKAWLSTWRDVPVNDAGGISGYNSTHVAKRSLLEKPSLSASDWQSVDPALMNRLALFCERFGYEFPLAG